MPSVKPQPTTYFLALVDHLSNNWWAFAKLVDPDSGDVKAFIDARHAEFKALPRADVRSICEIECVPEAELSPPDRAAWSRNAKLMGLPALGTGDDEELHELHEKAVREIRVGVAQLELTGAPSWKRLTVTLGFSPTATIDGVFHNLPGAHQAELLAALQKRVGVSIKGATLAANAGCRARDLGGLVDDLPKPLRDIIDRPRRGQRRGWALRP